MMRARGLGRKVRDRDSLITVGCVLAIAFAFVLLWRLGVPLPLLILGLLLSCLAACLLFMILVLRNHRKAHEHLARLQEGRRKDFGWSGP